MLSEEGLTTIAALVCSLVPVFSPLASASGSSSIVLHIYRYIYIANHTQSLSEGLLREDLLVGEDLQV
jgi:hypothetical protein